MLTATIFTAILNSGSVDYNVYQYGPHTVYEGTARLHADEDDLYPCLEYSFPIPEGNIRGPAPSSDSGQPMIPFDSWNVQDGELNISWCRTTLPLHPFTGEDLQCCYPIEIPRHFIFYVTKPEFNSDDLAKLLSDWGPPRWDDGGCQGCGQWIYSPWDLNGDTNVDGADLCLLLSSWKTD